MTVFTVTNLSDSGAGSLRAEIGSANAGDLVTFSPKLSGQAITLTSGQINLTPGITIQGPGGNQLSIIGNGQSGIFACDQDSNQKVTTISGLVLENGSAEYGAAIDFGPSTSDGSLVVSGCFLESNVVTAAGGAIASNGNLSVNSCTFYDNSVVAASSANGDLGGFPALGGAIWCTGTTMQLTNSNFYVNQVTGGAGPDGGLGEGGAVAWQLPASISPVSGVSLVMWGNTFDYNAVVGGSGVSEFGGEALGGAVSVDATMTDGIYVDVSGNTFNGNTATGSTGPYGGSAYGGSLQISSSLAYGPTFIVDHNQFYNGGVYGGSSIASQVSNGYQSTWTGGGAYGGAFGFDAVQMQDPFLMFYDNTISGTIAQGGTVAAGPNGNGGYAQGGDASGGGVFIDSANSNYGQYYVESATVSGTKAIGGTGGNSGLNGLSGGDAWGGGITLDAGNSNTPYFQIDLTTITNCTAIGGTGGSGLQASFSDGGVGGSGANSYGGGLAIDPEDSTKAYYAVGNDNLVSDTATGGQGGIGANGAHGFKGGSGSAGGSGEGGGLAVEVGLKGYDQEGDGQATGFEIGVDHCEILVDQAVGGKGGFGGNGSYGGSGGGGGFACGGAASVNGFQAASGNDVTFSSDFLFACAVDSGSGGAGGIGISYNGGKGGSSQTGVGGGLEVGFGGSVELKSTTIIGNEAAGSIGGQGGWGLVASGANGLNGYGYGGGVYVYTVSGGSVRKSSDTIILNNSADGWPDVYGTIGNL